MLDEIELNKEEVEYLVYRLEECRKTHYFYPAELCERVFEQKTISFYLKYSKDEKEH